MIAQRYTQARDRLLDDANGARRGSRWRAVPMLLAGLAAIGSMFALVSANVMAVNFTTTDTKFNLYSNYIEAQQLGGFMTAGTQSSSKTAVADLGIKTLNLVGVCIVAQQSTPFPMSIIVTSGMAVPDPVANWDSSDTAGAANDPFDTDAVLPSVTAKLNAAGQIQNVGTDPDVVSAEFGYLNTTMLTGFGHKIAGLYLGETADNVNTHAGLGAWPTDGGGQTPTPGDFGVYAQQLNLSGVGGGTYGLNLKGSITLPKLNIRLLPGARTQADCS